MRARCIVSLAAFERDLLGYVGTELAGQMMAQTIDGPSDLRQRLFEKWGWAIDVRQTLEECLAKEKRVEYGNDLTLLGRLFYHTLEHSPEHGNRRFRTRDLEKDNEKLFVEAEKIPSDCVDIVPDSADEDYWDVFAAMCRSKPELMGAITDVNMQTVQGDPSLWQLEPAVRNSAGFSIWRVVRMFQLSIRRPQNRLLIESTLLDTEIFRSRYDMSDNGGYVQKDDQPESKPEEPQNGTGGIGEVGQESGTDRLVAALMDISDDEKDEVSLSSRSSDEPDVMNRDIDNAVFDESTFIDNLYQSDIESDGQPGLAGMMKLEIRRFFCSIPNPAFFLEFIPFEELTDIIQLPNSSHTEFFGTWRARDSHILFDQIFTEEEVYQYCIQANWQFPDQRYQGGSAVILTPIHETDFLKDLQKFWVLWSDCKITESPQNGVLLVQTFSGCFFRDVCVTRDQYAARKYFHRIARDHSLALDSAAALKALLGTAWRRGYHGLLEYIPRDHFSFVGRQPLGSGAHGCVYPATWKQPCGLLSEVYPGFQLREVVLKQLFDESISLSKSRESLFKELQATQLALSGLGTGCISFYGVTEISLDELDICSSSHTNRASSTSPAKTLCLVFERAGGGTILSYLDRKLRSHSRVSNDICWTLLLVSFEMLFNGLITLHDRGILHRDLHFNNVLVRTTIYETEVLSKREVEDCVLADLGEGKIIDEAHANREIEVKEGGSAKSYLVGEFKPPEVKGRKGWSAKGDVYSLGIMMAKIVAREWNMRRSEKGGAESDDGERTNEYFQIPKAFKEFCRTCVQEDPAARPTAREAVRKLEKLSLDVERSKCEWVDFVVDDDDDAGDLLY